MTPTKLLVGQIVIVFALVGAGVWAVTQYCAHELGYQRALGPCWFVLGELPVYRPWSLFIWWQLLKGVAMSTLLGVGAELSIGSSDDDLVTAVRESIEQNAARTGDQLVSHNLNVQPTIRVRPGWPLRVLITKDIVLEPWRG